jgi:transcription elongation factor GreA
MHPFRPLIRPRKQWRPITNPYLFSENITETVSRRETVFFCYHNYTMPIPRHKKIDPESINLEPVYLTPAGIAALEKDLERLKKRLPALAEEAARTAAYGDRSDNAEYKQAKGALRGTRRHIYGIEDQLKRVVAIQPGTNADGTVRQGSVVNLLDLGEKKEKRFEILGASETDPMRGRISDQSPLGKALVGRAVGDVVTIKTEKGEKEYRILKVK